MKRSRIAMMGTAIVVLPVAVGGFMMQRREATDAARLFAQVFARVAADAVDSVPPDAMYEKAARGLVRSLNDPYADLYSPQELASFSRNSLGNAYGGVGMLIEDQQGTFTVAKVYPHTPAEAGGVQLGDHIVSVNGVATKGLKLEGVSGRLTGTPGSNVTVTFARGGVSQPIESQFTRAVVHIPAVPYALMLDERIGYIPVQKFNETSGEEVETALRQLAGQGAKSFVLDLRGNGGGDFDESLRMANLFLKRGLDIVTVRTRTSAPVVSRAVEQPIVPDAPLVVLTDGYTASASEIVAGSLQDHDRGVIIGTTSFGKGLVQTLFTLEGGWALKMTTGKWFTPSGRSIQRERKLLDDGRLVEVIPDSLETDSVRKARPAFKSDVGRVVYGGGGITPDVIIPSDTITDAEQTFLKALAPKSQESYLVLYQTALEQKKAVAPTFTVSQAWRDSVYARLTRAGVQVTRSEFDAARNLIDRDLERRVASMAFGDSAAFRRSVSYDTQLRRAIDLLHSAGNQRELLAAVAPAPRPRSD
jgi:carboxyl-terminal processing protease